MEDFNNENKDKNNKDEWSKEFDLIDIVFRVLADHKGPSGDIEIEVDESDDDEDEDEEFEINSYDDDDEEDEDDEDGRQELIDALQDLMQTMQTEDPVYFKEDIKKVEELLKFAYEHDEVTEQEGQAMVGELLTLMSHAAEYDGDNKIDMVEPEETKDGIKAPYKGYPVIGICKLYLTGEHGNEVIIEPEPNTIRKGKLLTYTLCSALAKELARQDPDCDEEDYFKTLLFIRDITYKRKYGRSPDLKLFKEDE